MLASPHPCKLVADLLTKAGADPILTMDPTRRTNLGSGYLDDPNKFPIVFAKDIKKPLGYVEDPDVEQSRTVFVPPDAGGAVRAPKFADMFYGDVAIVDKRRPQV